jgi:predicted 3-demethylubiquinone-9 3-methyltransferase (glyoxalase superfamily)
MPMDIRTTGHITNGKGLWQAEEAMHFHVSIFENSKVVGVARYGDAGPGSKGSVMTASASF